ncbi:TraR/DksA family transcriptional regulator [Leclercia adecarboxylata]|uniref:TraR/DksA family transcriptional regulator n=1 Tax=Leclercia adecarboxylata TaxID=83655 RepID=A0A9X4BCQ8_9ENTR|nr:TraR/DksA family transcriptional regulator [Leclercia adecarboxylata]MBD1404277.1 TraR/DksA family transcriptional regulator [Leclercia adecarboxylata]MDC6621906.1 TraR/DksA family transcriptional regulator [Leclercia adecarboxylata]MDC6632978.1 TraR/DksA family transcriptional regulator [Leclercia adecarboxylata]MDC6638274.1 TraR/DksA family transcriptional regulator [Leclercia adecarboxylata]MDC6649017.1 TraR/DksA family transcriptional regulator [Leclercia adecarboxylata]
MADFADDASAVEELQRNAALSAHRINRDAVSATHCVECDEQLPEARRKAYPGCTMCVDCQGEQELRNKQRAG